MKKMTVMALLAMGLLLAACGAQKNDLDIGHDLVQEGNCAEAAQHLDATIVAPEDIVDLAYAYFLKGKCAEKGGDIPAAYENYYAAQVVACYAVAHDTHVNLNTYSRSEFCQKIIPEMLEKLAPEAGDVQAIRDKVDAKLHDRYLERFALGTN